MQLEIREKGKGEMLPGFHDRFVNLHEDKKLLHPRDPAQAIVKILLHGKKELSGKFVDWTEDTQ